MTSERLQEQVEFLDAHTDVDVVGGQIYKFSDDPERSTVSAHRPLSDADIKIYMVFSDPLFIGTTTIRRESLRASRVLFDESYSAAGDHEFLPVWLRI